MDKSNKKEFFVTISGLAVEFGGKAEKNNVKLRFKALIEYSIEDIKKAAIWLLKNRTEKYPPIPTTREIIQAIEKISGIIDPKIAANLECDKILRNLGNLGRECVSQFKDPITQHLMTHRWSFMKLDQESMKDPTFKWFRRDFVEAYLDYKKEDIVVLDCGSGTIPIEDLKKLLPEGKICQQK